MQEDRKAHREKRNNKQHKILQNSKHRIYWSHCAQFKRKNKIEIKKICDADDMLKRFQKNACTMRIRGQKLMKTI